MMIGKAL